MRWLFLIIFLLNLVLPPSQAIKLGVSPQEIDFSIYKDGYDEKKIVVFNPNPFEVIFEIQASDFDEWFSFSPLRGTIRPNDKALINIRANPGKPFPSSEYEINFLINLAGYDKNSINIQPGIGVKGIVRFTNIEEVKGYVHNLKIKKQNGKFLVSVDFENIGNVIATPSVMITFFDGENVTSAVKKNLLEYNPKERKFSDIVVDSKTESKANVKVFLNEVLFDNDYFFKENVVKKDVLKNSSMLFILSGAIGIVLIFIVIKRIM